MKKKNIKFIVITGGVLSGLGKGITTASVGKLLSTNLKIVPVKCDGYLNTDPGTMNPIEHGEVFVLDDGGEVDMDFGHYERFLGVHCQFKWNLTMGKIFKDILEMERTGVFLGKTVQLIPHVTDRIKQKFWEIGTQEAADLLMIEIGGTVGDMENELFIEAVRQLKNEVGPNDIVFIHLTYVPIMNNEQKSKPTQQSVKLLNERGIRPDVIIGRSSGQINEKIKEKISLFCDIPKEAVVSDYNVDSVYELPLIFEEEGLCAIIHKKLGIYSPPSLVKWSKLVDALKKVRQGPAGVNIAMCGKYTDLEDSYASYIEALRHCEAHLNLRINLKWVETTEIEKGRIKVADVFKETDGVIVPGGFGQRGTEGKIQVIQYARENSVPFLGICYGMQLAIIEFARHVCGLALATSLEVAREMPDCQEAVPVICILPDQQNIKKLGGTMRLGGYDVAIKPNTQAARVFGRSSIRERFRHRYEVNPEYVKTFEEMGVVFSGYSPSEDIVQIFELPQHPFFMGCQFHPELISRLEEPSPIYYHFIKTVFELKTANLG